MKQLILIFIIFFSLYCLSFAESATEEDAYAVFLRGMKLENQLRFFEARDQFITAISMAPDNTGYLEHYAWFLMFHGFTEEASNVFRQLVEVNDDRMIFIGLGWTLQEIGQLEDSLIAYRRVWPWISTDLEPAILDIREAFSQKNINKINALKNKIAQSPELTDLHIALIKAFIDRGDFPDAIRISEYLADHNRLDMPTRLWFARALFWNGDLQRAEKEYLDLAVQAPQSAFVLMELSDVYLSQGRLQDARDTLEKALALYSDAALIRKKLAEVLARIGLDSQAEEVARSIEKVGHDRLVGLMARARVYHFSGQLTKAHSIYVEVGKEYPYLADALWGRTETAIYTGRYRDALDAMVKWEASAPDQRLGRQRELADLYYSPHAALKTSFYSNSEGYKRKDVGVVLNAYIGGDWRSETGYVHSKFSQRGYKNIQRNALFVIAEKVVSPVLQIEGELWGHFYDNSTDHLNASLATTLTIAHGIKIRPYFRHYDIIDTYRPFQDALYTRSAIGSVGLGITSDEYGIGLFYNPTSRLSISGEFNYGDYSDDNQKRNLQLDVIYRLTHRPEWDVSYSYFLLDFKNPAPSYIQNGRSTSAYFDPIDFDTHTIRLSYRNNQRSNLNYGCTVALSYNHQTGIEGIGTTLAAFASWRMSKALTLNVEPRWFYQGKGVDRLGETGFYHAEYFVTKFEYRF